MEGAELFVEICVCFGSVSFLSYGTHTPMISHKT